MRRSRGPSTEKHRAAASRPVRAALVIYLASYLVWAGPFTGGLWARGEHATPEHWAHHLLLEHLGFAHHHGPAEDAGPPEQDQAPEVPEGLVVASPLLLTPLIVAGPPAPAVSADSTLHQLAGAFPAPLGAEGGRRLVPLDGTIPGSLLPEPPEKPPRIDR